MATLEELTAAAQTEIDAKKTANGGDGMWAQVNNERREFTDAEYDQAVVDKANDDYNQQELNSLCLIYSEIFMALNLQKKGGTFICKLFDLFLKETIQLLYILFLSYEEIILNKPCLT